MPDIEKQAVDAIRVLAADAIEKAKSGHPGLPLGAAPAAYELFARHLKHNPQDPLWENRDRFILSGGHGSMLLYSLLHFFNYPEMTMDELKSFRQLGSKTPGHPEYMHTPGIEATTGPLGAGMAMAVGMAMAEAHLAAEFNRPGYPVVDHYTYALGGDGCMMEGISSEAFSLAGTLGLGKLIILYDSNRITIEGSTDLAFTENVAKRMQAFGFQTLDVPDGNDLQAIGKAIEEAKADHEHPSFITVHTIIGYGCPKKQGTASCHGAALGQENVDEMKDFLGWPSKEPFYVPDEVYAHYRTLAEDLPKAEDAWQEMFAAYGKEYPELLKKWETYHDRTKIREALDNSDFWDLSGKEVASRYYSEMALNKAKELLPNFLGGSADLASSNMVELKDAGIFSKENYAGRNIYFGIREIAMAAIGNGLLLHGGLIPFVATFFVFSDYVKPMARLSSIMKVPLIYVFSHDSIGVGEDGQTHEPIEQLAMFRSMPNFNVIRPADELETRAAWYQALTSEHTPTAIILSRQTIKNVAGTSKEAMKGAYILQDAEKAVPDGIIIASGSEVPNAVEAKAMLLAEGIDVRVVSMPSMEIFEQQSPEYKESVLPKNVRARVAVEAAASFGWDRYVGLDGKTVCMESFGASAPNKVLFEHFGFTAKNVAEAVKSVL